MYKVKRRADRRNTFARERGSISPYFSPPPNRRIWRGSGRRRRSGREGGGRVGRKGPARAQVFASVTPARIARQEACRASACDAIEAPCHCPHQRIRGTPLHRAPAWHASRATCTGRQRPTVAPSAVARPNGLWRNNITTTGLKLKYY